MSIFFLVQYFGIKFAKINGIFKEQNCIFANLILFNKIKRCIFIVCLNYIFLINLPRQILLMKIQRRFRAIFNIYV